MYITVQFKDKNKVFKGRTYDYKICDDEPEKPARGDIIRMMDKDYNYICYGTRVKVVDVKENSLNDVQEIRFIKTTLD